MLALLKKKLIHTKEVAGIRLKLLADDQWELSCCMLENKKGIVRLKNQKETLQLEELNAFLTPKTPIRIIIDGKGVLYKKIDNTKEENREILLQQAIPNAKTKDFYIQKYVSKHGAFIVVIRRTVFENIIKKFQAKGWYVTYADVGPFAVQQLIPLMEHNTLIKTLYLPEYKISVNDDKTIQEVVLNQETQDRFYKIGNENIPASNLLSYVAAVQAFLNTKNSFIPPIISFLKEEWEQRKIFNQLYKVGLLLVFIILFLNFLTYMSFSEKEEKLNSAYMVQAGTLQRLEYLKNEVDQKKMFLDQFGWSGKSQLTFYADRLAAIRPENIQWLELTIHPINQEIFKKEKRQIYESKAIIVKGKCKSPLIFNNWLSKVEKLDWVKEINQQAYNYDDKNKVGIFQFKMILF